MRKLLLIWLFAISLTTVSAQDKIITIRMDTIECLILSVNAERIIYEQKTDGGLITGKSISISDVLQYFRSEQPESKGEVYCQKHERRQPELRYLFSLQCGAAHTFTDFSDFKNMIVNNRNTAQKADDYIKKLKNGYHVSSEFHYLLTTFLGLGAGYSFFYSESEGKFFTSWSVMNIPIFSTVEIDEKIYTHFAGISALFQQSLGRNKTIRITETISPGVVFFRDEARGMEIQNFGGLYQPSGQAPPQYYDYSNSRTKSSAFGIKGGLSAEYCITPNLSAGLNGNFMWSKLYKLSAKNSEFDIEGQKLEKAINISRIDYGITVRYNF